MEEAPQKPIQFSPPDITQAEADAVIRALRSGWITTGPATKRFERELATFMGTPAVAALNSATAAEECALRLLGIGPGDEVITSAYTYTSTAAAIVHVGAVPVMCDTAPDSYEMDYGRVADLVTERTRAVVPVDIGGRMCDYDVLRAALDDARAPWRPHSEAQEAFGHLPIVADAAHALGASRKGDSAGTVADMTTFSFHAVKNLTTAEGGALTWRAGTLDDERAYRRVMLMSLHGQSKDALAKTRAGAWEYDVAFPGWKCNMTDMAAALGSAQLRRYPDMLARRRALVSRYEAALADGPFEIMTHYDAGGGAQAEKPNAPLSNEEAARRRSLESEASDGFASSGHLMLVRLHGKSMRFRNEVIERMGAQHIACNVHYKPLPLMTAYKDLGFDIADFPCALAQFQNEVTLPLHTLLSDDDADRVAQTLKQIVADLEREGAR